MQRIQESPHAFAVSAQGNLQPFSVSAPARSCLRRGPRGQHQTGVVEALQRVVEDAQAEALPITCGGRTIVMPSQGIVQIARQARLAAGIFECVPEGVKHLASIRDPTHLPQVAIHPL